MNDRNSKATLAKNIRHYMELHNKTRNEMCTALNVKYTTFTDWVNAKTYPRIERIEQIASYFGIETSVLLEDPLRLPSDAILYQERPSRPIPIIGAINCGVPLLAEDNIEGYHETSLQDITSGETYFWLRAKGNSMVNVGIHEGDLLLIRQQNDVDSGDIAVVSIDENDATLKRVIKKENALILQPENPAYETKIFIGEEINSVQIRGRLMKLEKRF
ncbi:MAG: helix-turn-helix domain-containing protein [Anaerotignum sp.]|nr:helix-turn-helix domain-containing protein [Anaerotignum sp.]